MDKMGQVVSLPSPVSLLHYWFSQTTKIVVDPIVILIFFFLQKASFRELYNVLSTQPVLNKVSWKSRIQFRPSKKKDVSCPDFYKKKRGGWALFFCLLFPIACFLYTFPQGYVGALRSNINKTKNQILIKYKFV